MLKITAQYYERKENFEPDYGKSRVRYFYGEQARDCMSEYNSYVQHHNIAKYTPTRITNVEEV